MELNDERAMEAWKAGGKKGPIPITTQDEVALESLPDITEMGLGNLE